jgi:hypothetical protein
MVQPIERRRAGAGTDPYRKASLHESLDHAVAGLAGAAEHEKRLPIVFAIHRCLQI